MSIHAGDILANPAELSYHEAMLALSHLPDRCALDVTELARRIGADKLELITWVRADIDFARLIASKITT
jgi:hypothetical protein